MSEAKSSGNSLHTRDTLQVDSTTYHYHSLPKAAEQLGDLTRLPVSLKVLLETCCATRMV